MQLEVNPKYEATYQERKLVAGYLKDIMFLKRTIKRRHTNKVKKNG